MTEETKPQQDVSPPEAPSQPQAQHSSPPQQQQNAGHGPQDMHDKVMDRRPQVQTGQHIQQPGRGRGNTDRSKSHNGRNDGNGNG